MAFIHAGEICTYGLLLAPQTVSFLSGFFNCDTEGKDLDLRALRPDAAESLRQTWRTAANDESRCQLLFDWLQGLINKETDKANHWANLASLPLLLLKGNEAACIQLGIGTRQLERLTRLQLGMSPHCVRTVLRLHATLLRAMGASAPQSGADLALSQGYYDQSHMSRDLKRLAGLPIGHAMAASQGLDESEWALHVGRQLVNRLAPLGEPNKAAAQTQDRSQNTSTHTARDGAVGAHAIPRR